MQIGFIVILIIAIFVAIFAIQNGDMVSLDLFLTKVNLPLAVVIMACIILGAVIVLILGTTRQFKNRSETKEMKNKLKTLEGDRILADNNIKSMETEIQTLMENNSSLISKISELEERNKKQSELIDKLENEFGKVKVHTQTNPLIESNITDESIGTEKYDEKSEVQSE